MIVILTLLSLLFVIILFAYYLSTRKFDYWKKKNVPFIKPVPLFGNFLEYILIKKYEGHVAQEICHKFPDAPYIGTFFGTEPMLLVQDPELIKLIAAKDFYYFHGRAVSSYNHKEQFTQSLFFSSGDHWRVMRQNLTPLFSSAKMKNMFYLIKNCAAALDTLLEQETSDSPVIEVRSLMTKYTMDCMGSCSFGVSTNTLSDNDEFNPFLIMGTKIFELSIFRDVKLIIRSIWPGIFYGLGFKVFPVEINAFFKRLLIGVFKSREYKPTLKHDFVDLVLNFKKDNYISGDTIHNLILDSGKKIRLEANDDWLVGQCAGLFAGGFETSASTSSFTLYELAKNQDAQRRARAEVDAYLSKNNGKISYECVAELPYLEACISEALRLYPVLGVLTREVMEDYTLPDGLRLEKGLRVHLPVYHLHHHPDYFPEPEKFRPERFLSEERNNIKRYTVLSFGEGSRICIGIRFAKMQLLPGLMTILKKYQLDLAEGTPTTLPLEPATIVTRSKCGLYLKFTPRTEEST